MLKHRLIATLLCRNGRIVQSIGFNHTNVIGNVITAVDFFNTWAIDEIVILDVSREKENQAMFFSVIQDLSRRCFVPLSVGGFVQSINDIRNLIKIGADKVIINTHAFKDPDFIHHSSEIFGNQCIVVSIDVKKNDVKNYEVFVDRGRKPTGVSVIDWCVESARRGAGEIYLTSIDNDGARNGYDLDLIKLVTDAVDIPVIASGGVGKWEHLEQGINTGNAQAVSAANIFHFTEHSTKKAKEYLEQTGLDVRKTDFYKIKKPRKPKYEFDYCV
jgi:cyclase